MLSHIISIPMNGLLIRIQHSLLNPFSIINDASNFININISICGLSMLSSSHLSCSTRCVNCTNGRQVTFKMYYHTKGARIEAWGCTIGGLLYLLMPYFFCSFWVAFKLSLVTNLVSSLFFSLQFVVNHEVDTIIDDKPHAATVDFGQFQLEESFTFCPDSPLALELSGGLNTQIEHHLFPGVHYSHYGAISKIIRSVAKRFNLDYQHSHSWWGAVKKHYKLLKNPPQSVRIKRDNFTPKMKAAMD